jgi:hypothetical protein
VNRAQSLSSASISDIVVGQLQDRLYSAMQETRISDHPELRGFVPMQQLLRLVRVESVLAELGNIEQNLQNRLKARPELQGFIPKLELLRTSGVDKMREELEGSDPSILKMFVKCFTSGDMEQMASPSKKKPV